MKAERDLKEVIADVTDGSGNLTNLYTGYWEEGVIPRSTVFWKWLEYQF